MTETGLCFTHEGSAGVRGKKLTYRLEGKEFPIYGEDGGKEASLFSWTYLRTDTGTEEAAERPVIFGFNGGPGSSSIWIHMGFMGPLKMKYADAVHPPVLPPYEMEENTCWLLDTADIVLIDPVGTGYGRLLRKDRAGEYFNISQDARLAADLIEAWLREHGRRNSPVYLLGESYGTLRAPMLVGELMGGPTTQTGRMRAIAVAGIIFMGTVRDFEISSMEKPDPTEVYTMAAVNRWWMEQKAHGIGKEPAQEDEAHGIGREPADESEAHDSGKEPAHEGEVRGSAAHAGREQKEYLDEVWRFADGEYRRLLPAVGTLPPKERRALAEKLSGYTGLSSAQWEASLSEGKSVSLAAFAQKLLEEDGLDIGIYDARYSMRKTRIGSFADVVADDPAMGAYTPSMTGAFESIYLPAMGVKPGQDYVGIDFSFVNAGWSYECAFGRGPLDCLKLAARRNPGMRIFLAAGLYDLCTQPGFAKEFAARGDIPAEQIVYREYASGHMPYLGEESLRLLTEDIREFLRQGCAR